MLTKFNKIAEAGREVVATDIPPSEIGTMMSLALKTKSLPVSSAAMVPPLINPNAPDFALVHSTVQKAIEDSEAIDKRANEPAVAITPSPSTAAAKPKSAASSSRSSQTDDLEQGLRSLTSIMRRFSAHSHE